MICSVTVMHYSQRIMHVVQMLTWCYGITELKVMILEIQICNMYPESDINLIYFYLVSKVNVMHLLTRK